MGEGYFCVCRCDRCVAERQLLLKSGEFDQEMIDTYFGGVC